MLFHFRDRMDDPEVDDDRWEDDKQEGDGEDKDVAAYKNLIVEMEREIAEQSADSSNEQDLIPATVEFPLTSQEFEKCLVVKEYKETSPTQNGVLHGSMERKDNLVGKRDSPIPIIHTSMEDAAERTLTPTSPRSTSPILIRTPSPVLHRSTSPLFVKDVPKEKPRAKKRSLGEDHVVHINTTDCTYYTGNGKAVWKENTDSIAGKKAKCRKKPVPEKSTLRTFKQRSAQENFGLYGLLTPVLCLVPMVDGHDALTQTFSDLCGEHRELKLAAAHIEDAISGRGKWGKARAFFTSRTGQLCFKVISNSCFVYVVILAAVLHMISTLLEPPPVGETSPVVFALTLVSLLVYTIDVCVHIGFLSWRVFWSLDENKWMRVEFFFLCMFTIDFIMLLIQEIVQMRLLQPFRCLRAAIIICKLKNVGHIFDTVLSIMLNLIKTFFVIMIFIIMFSATGVHLFSDAYHFIACNSTNTSNCTDNTPNIYTGAFDHIGITALRLFVLLSTENYPEFMIPAYNKNSSSFFYFGIFIFVGVFCLTAILLAVIVDSYWEFAKKHVKTERARERAELAKAWNLLDPLGKGSLPISDDQFIRLFKILKPQNTDEMNMQLISYLDSNQDGEVDSLEWTIRLNEALGFEFEMDEIEDLSSSPKWYLNMKGLAKKVIFSVWFARVILVLIAAHCVLFCMEWRGLSETSRFGIAVGKSAIVGIFVVEACLRVFTDWRILKDMIEILDVILILIALVNNILWYFSTEYGHLFDVISSLAVSFRVGLNSAQTKRAVLLFFTKIFPVMFDLIILVFVILFLYAIVGFELFYSWTPNRSYSSGHYDYNCQLGFESVGCSLLIVYQIVTTSNWHEIMNSAIVSTSYWACLYFILGFIFINLIVMNLFVAIAIEAFNKLGTEKELAAALDTHRSTETEKQDANFAESAKTFLNSLLESSRVEQEKGRTERTNRQNSPRMRRPSRVSVVSGGPSLSPVPVAIISQRSPKTPEPLKSDNADEQEAEDYSSLTPQERKRKQLKKKMMDKKRRKAPKTKVVVVTAYRGVKDQELDLKVGDEVTIIKKQDDWWEGQIDDRKGWFPASHVKEAEEKSTVRFTEEKAPDSYSDAPKPAWNTDTLGMMNDTENTMSNDSRKDSLKSLGLVTIAGKTKPRLKVKNTGSWRKEILGDITVMNPEELKALNKILKGQSGRGSLTDSLTLGQSSKKPPPLINEEYNESSSSKPMPHPPQRIAPPKISLERADTLPDLAEVEEDDDELSASKQSSASKNTLTVEKPEAPPSVKKKNREASKNGEMPSWMQKFAQDNQLNVLSDVKFDEMPTAANASQSQSSDEELQTLPGKVQPSHDSAV